VSIDFVYEYDLFIHQWLYSPLLGPGLFFSFVIFLAQKAGLLAREISLSQDRYLHAGQHKHRINAHTNIHALSETRTHDPSVWAGEDGSCYAGVTFLIIKVREYHRHCCRFVEKRFLYRLYDNGNEISAYTATLRMPKNEDMRIMPFFNLLSRQATSDLKLSGRLFTITYFSFV
jgi:hypothetical protein